MAAGDVAALAASASCRRRGYRLRYVTSPGRARQVSVRAGSLTILDAGEISSSTHGTGQGGNVGVTASDIVLTGAGSAIANSTTSTGNAATSPRQSNLIVTNFRSLPDFTLIPIRDETDTLRR